MNRINFRTPLFLLFSLCLLLCCFGAIVMGGLPAGALALPCLMVVFTLPRPRGAVRSAATFLRPIGQVGAVLVREAMERIVTIKYTHSADTVTDTIYLLNGRVMLAMNSAAANILNIFMIGGLIEYTSETGVAWTAGDKLYWDDTGKKFTKTSTSNTLCGIAYEDKASAGATGLVLLIPTP